MNRNKRVVSCPNLLPRCNRRLENEINNSAILKKIESQYAKCTPRVLGHPVKLSDLFAAVVIRGGYRVVCEQRLWSDVARALYLPSACTNCSVGLRRLYYQYLSKHELAEYPTLSENYMTQNFVDFSGADTIVSDLSRMPATSVERNLGIDQYLPSGGLSHSNYHSFSELSDVLSRPSRAALPTQDASWFSGSIDKTLTERSDPDGVIRCVPGGYTNFNDPARLRDLSELRLAELALESGLPNEVDVALNSLLALSVTPSITGASSSIRLAQCSNLLNLILATVGIYDDSSSSFIICDPVWRKQTQLDFLKFWHNMIEDREGRLFLRPDVFINADADASDDSNDSPSFVELFAPASMSTVPFAGSGAACLRVSELNEDVETSRTLLVATILVNLVTPSPTYSGGRFEDDDDESEYDALVTRTLTPYSSIGLSSWRENARYIAASPTGLRFAFLTSHARHSGLRQLGLQLLSSLRYPLDPPPVPMTLDCPDEWTPLMDSGCRLGDLTLSFLARSILDSHDRASIIAGLNFLSNLAKVPDKANETSLINGLPSAVWPRLAQLICLPDLAVVCAGLDALRCFTNLGHFACLFAWQACLEREFMQPSELPLSLLQPLLALLTLEGQAMGSQSLHRIKLMQRLPPPVVMHPHNQSRSMPHPVGRTHPAPSDLVAHSQQYRATTGMHTYGVPYIPRSAPQRVFPQSNTERVPSCLSGPSQTQHVPGGFVTTVARPPRVDRPHPPLSTELTPTPIGPTYRPPSGSTSCKGLINLLTSITSPSSCSVPGTLTVSSPTTAVPTSPTMVLTTNSPLFPNPSFSSSSTALSAGCAKSTSTTVSSSSPTLSELTDRLQMPPPSLPPPSALRRSSKSAQPRTSTTTMTSPPTVSRLKSESSSLSKLPSSLSASVPMSVSSVSEEAAATQGVVGSTSTHEDINQSTVCSRSLNHTSSTERVKTENASTADKALSSPPSAMETSASCMNGIIDHFPLPKPTEMPAKQAKLKDNLYDSRKPLMNGELKVDINGDSEPDQPQRTQTDRSTVAVSSLPVLNGLKPGILQAAMKVLEDQDVNTNPGIVSTDKLSPEPESTLVNGVADPSEPPSAVESKIISNNSNESQSDPTSQSQTGLNGVQKPVTDDPIVNTSEDKSSPTAAKDNKIPGYNPNDDTAVPIVNGNSESNSSSSSSETDLSPETQTRNLKPTRYFLKRRRRWGSRSRLLTPKRRREHTQVVTPNSGSPSKLTTTTSPLKPLPLQSDPLPDSVLGPSWKPVWCSATEMPVSSAPATVQKGSTGVCSLSHGNRQTKDNNDENPAPSLRSEGDQNGVDHDVHVNSATSNPLPATPSYLCEWESCTASFEEKSQVSSHVYLTHLATKQPDSSAQSSAYVHPALPVRRCCRWRSCSSSSLARAPFALLTHVLDVHCSPMELDTAMARSHSRAQTRLPPCSTEGTSSSSSLSDLQNLCSTFPADMSSSPSGDPSAWGIVRALEAKQMQLDLWAAQHHFISANPCSRLPLSIFGPNPHHPQSPMIAPPPREGPVTKHLRVSAALVIRNLVTYIEEARTWLLSELPLLSEVVMGCSPSDGNLRTNDAGRIVAQCLSICSRAEKRTNPVGPFLPTKPLPDECLPRDLLLPLLRNQLSHSRHRRHHGLSPSPPVHRPPVFNVDLDARGS